MFLFVLLVFDFATACSSSISKCIFDDFYFVFPHLNLEYGFQGEIEKTATAEGQWVSLGQNVFVIRRELDQFVYVWTNLFSPSFSFRAFLNNSAARPSNFCLNL